MKPEEYREIRKGMKLTQTGLAILLGVTKGTIRNRECGARISQEARLALLRLKDQYEVK